LISIAQIKEKFETRADPLVKILIKLGVSPNMLTVAGCLLLIAAAVFLGNDRRMAAILLFLPGAVLDALDGKLARDTGRASPWGAFLDSTLDRLAETAIAIGLLYWFHGLGRLTPFLSACIVGGNALSLMVSYTRARAEGLGLECRQGLLQRPHRGILIFIGLLLGSAGMVFIIYVILVLSLFTMAQRMMHVYRNTARSGPAA
jgi:CDP-diacylglycerol--glycerol-3-phosphate 3-phosphatidyltransferase